MESFVTHFPDSRDETNKEPGVKDPRIIRLCNTKQWLLVTTDSEIRFTHIEEIKRSANVAILATSHNSVEDIDEWVDALIKAKVRIEREFRKRLRPWYAQYNRQGKITTIYTVTETHGGRRNRPAEQDTKK